MASNLLAMASNLEVMDPNLRAMAPKLRLHMSKTLEPETEKEREFAMSN